MNIREIQKAAEPSVVLRGIRAADKRRAVMADAYHHSACFTQGRPRFDRIVIREVQYQFEVNGLKGNFGWAWPMRAGCPRVGDVAMLLKKVLYQFEVNPCRNEEIIVKGNFWWTCPRWPGRPRINRIVIKEVQYQFEVNRCRNEEIIVKGNFRWARPMWVGRPRIDHIVIREVRYQFDYSENAILGGRGLCGRGAPGLIDRIVIRDVQYQFEDNRCRNEESSSANSVGDDSGQDGRTDRG
ncbi:hypothetical protein DPMN_159108 [Dreissena polymorpha]|uniref:Uncharacterized protein n=1 Tax=Dreissena polymorpha TaxID=45954 RepID=A0A9D4EKE9_DREPO|nr:hypothetical protein DPMN_159108 [Dreissena polymorpha]